MLGAWAMAIPYLGPSLGLQLDVPPRVEIVDHVLPGLIVLAASAVMLALRRGGRSWRTPWLVAGGLAFLAGFWITSTHVPLALEAIRGLTPWPPALWHNLGGPPIVALALWMLLGPSPRPRP